MEEPSQGAAKVRPWLIAVVAALVTLGLVAAGGAGYLLGKGSGPSLGHSRATGARQGRLQAARELTPALRSKARREGLRSGYKVAYKRAFKTARKATAAGGPHNCGDVTTNDTPSIGKVRAEGVSCPTAIEFARSTRSCQDPTHGCNGYTCTTVDTGYEEGEFTCRRGPITIRFLSGV